MTFLQFLEVLHARRGALIGLTALGFILALVWRFSTEKTYVAGAEVLVNIRAPETVGTQTVADQLAPGYLATQLDIARSDRVAQRAVQIVGLAANSQAARAMGWTTAGQSLQSFWAQRIKDGLKLNASATSRVVTLSYSSTDAKFAAAAANAFATAYRDVSLELQNDPARQSALWYDTNIRELEAQWTAAQRKLSIRQRELGVTAGSSELDAESARLAALSSQLAQAEAQRAVAKSRATGGGLPETLASPVIHGLQTDLARLEAQRQQIGTIAGHNNVDYRQISQQIESLKQQIAQQHATIESSTKAAAAQTDAGVASLTTAIAEQKERVINARERRDELAVLEQEVASIKSTYDQITQRRSQLNLLGGSAQTNIVILSLAKVPATPSWPRAGLMLPLGAAAGFILGALLALLSELLHRRLHKPDDFESVIGIPNLGTIRRNPRYSSLHPWRRELLLARHPAGAHS